ncbi:MAG TPA: YbjN domain-containing protein [Arachnia sp.]|nr:YbjN domain-containing protein [Arachnia sp.]HMT85452.1 YbjN domain-containing protein [Arachnia sp.]
MEDLHDFDFDETTRQAWKDFSGRLDEVLSVMDASSDLTLSVTGYPERGVRFSYRKGSVRALLLSGGLEEPWESLGWLPADGTHPSYHATRSQEETTGLATLATRTLAGPLGVLHPVFLESDQLAEVLRGKADWANPDTERTVLGVMPRSQGELDRLVDAELDDLFGRQALRDAQGDVALRVGSAMVFLRSAPDLQELVVFSPLVHDVSGRSRACEVLNDLNVESRYGRFALHRDRVFVQLSVPANPFVAAHLRHALRVIAHIADGIDDELAGRLGGRTTFSVAD